MSGKGSSSKVPRRPRRESRRTPVREAGESVFSANLRELTVDLAITALPGQARDGMLAALTNHPDPYTNS